jgi:hypothetical protein
LTFRPPRRDAGALTRCVASLGMAIAPHSMGGLGERKELAMPGHKDRHATQARYFAIAFVALLCFVMVGALALVR